MSNDGLHEYRQQVEKSSVSRIYSDGTEYAADYLDEGTIVRKSVLEYDPLEFYSLVDLFLSEYGLGGCRHLEEFATMIDTCDPALIEGLKYAMHIRNTPDEELAKDPQNTKARAVVRKRKFTNAWGHDSEIGDFLANSGIPQTEIREAKKKAEGGKISKEEHKEFSEWLHTAVTPETIRDPNFNLKETHARIQAHIDKTENFTITPASIFGRK